MMRQTRVGPAWSLHPATIAVHGADIAAEKIGRRRVSSPQIPLLRGLLVGRPKPEDLAPAQVAGGEDGIGKRADSAAATGRRSDEATARDVRDDLRGGI